MTKPILATVLASLVVVVSARAEELPGEHSVLTPPETPPSTSPPQTIPLRDPTTWRTSRIYLAENSTYDLPAGTFLLFLPDFPQAILFKVRATPLGFDQDFYYFRDAMFDHEWAFGRQPADDFFAGHAIWSRSSGQSAWDLRTSDAQLASPPPALPEPRASSVVRTPPRREPARTNTQARQQPQPSNEARRRSQAADQTRERIRANQRNAQPPEREGLIFGRWRNEERGRN